MMVSVSLMLMNYLVAKKIFFFFCSVRNQISDDSSAFKGGVFEYVCDYSF